MLWTRAINIFQLPAGPQIACDQASGVVIYSSNDNKSCYIRTLHHRLLRLPRMRFAYRLFLEWTRNSFLMNRFKLLLLSEPHGKW